MVRRGNATAKNPSKEKDFTDTFEQHNVFLTPSGEQHRGECPFCNGSKFYANIQTGQWQCKTCSEEGNAYTFIEKLHANSLSTFKAYVKKNKGKETILDRLAKRRRLPVDALTDYGICPAVYNPKRLFLPHRNIEGKFANLKTYDTDHKTPKLFATAKCALQLYRGEYLAELSLEIPIYLTEGEWDCIALQYLLDQTEKPGFVVAVPGADQFKKDWIELFRDRIVYLVFDNDLAGKKGMDALIQKIGPVVKSLKRIEWAETYRDKYDINDLVADNIKTPKKTYAALQNFCVDVKLPKHSAPTKTGKDSKAAKDSPPEKPPVDLKPIKFTELQQFYRKKLHLDQNMSDALAIMFAVCLSAKLPIERGDCPLWVFMVGPPGVGKTLMLRALEYVEHCMYRTTLTAASLVSGWKNDDGEDCSLLKELGGRCLVTEDYGATRGAPVGVQEALHGYLRSAYNGRFDKTFGNEEKRLYNDNYFSFIAGVTHVIHGDSKASVGERFMKYEFLRENTPQKRADHIFRALEVANELALIEKKLREMAVRFFTFVELTNDNIPATPPWFNKRIACLAEITAILRTHVDRRQGELVCRPAVEIATRLAKQFQKMGYCLAAVFGLKEVNQECYRIVEQLALDTAYGWSSDVVRALSAAGKPLTLEQISKQARVSPSTALRKLEDLMEVDAITKTIVQTGKRGLPPHTYAIAPTLQKLWERAKISSKLLKTHNPIKKFGRREAGRKNGVHRPKKR